MNPKHKKASMPHFSRTRHLILTVVCLTFALPAIRAELVYSQSFSNNSDPLEPLFPRMTTGSPVGKPGRGSARIGRRW